MTLAELAVPVGVTWGFCRRSMPNGQHCGMGWTEHSTTDQASVERRAVEITRLREQVQELTAAADRAQTRL